MGLVWPLSGKSGVVLCCVFSGRQRRQIVVSCHRVQSLPSTIVTRLSSCHHDSCHSVIVINHSDPRVILSLPKVTCLSSYHHALCHIVIVINHSDPLVILSLTKVTSACHLMIMTQPKKVPVCHHVIIVIRTDVIIPKHCHQP